MKILRVGLAASAIVLALASVGAQAQELKIGYVNSDRVLREAAPAKAAQAKLEAEFSKREKELTDIGNRLKAAGEKLDALLQVEESEVDEMVEEFKELRRKAKK
jgi:outer membrane protein